MTPTQQTVTMVFGALLALLGLLLFATGKAKGKNKISLFGITAELSTPSLVVFIVGCGLFIYPAAMRKAEDQKASADLIDKPVPATNGPSIVPPVTNNVPVTDKTSRPVSTPHLPENIWLGDCAFLEGANLLVISGITASRQAVILISDNRGESFSSSKDPNLSAHPGGLCLCGSDDGRHLFAASAAVTLRLADGIILVSEDRGLTWAVHRLQKETQLVDASCSTDGRSVWVVSGGVPRAAHSEDFGKTWAEAVTGDPDAPLSCVVVSGDGGEIWLGGSTSSHAVIKRSRDGGNTWETTFFDCPGHESFPRIDKIATVPIRRTLWAFLRCESDKSHIISRSLLDGKWMQPTECPLVDDLFAAPDGKHLLSVSEKGIFESADSGLNWQRKQPPSDIEFVPRKGLRRICGTRDGRTLWAVGAETRIIRSTNGGATWTRLRP